MKKFLGITLVILFGITLIVGFSNQNQQNQFNNNYEQPMEQFVSTGDWNLDRTLSGIDYDLYMLQYNNELAESNTNY